MLYTDFLKKCLRYFSLQKTPQFAAGSGLFAEMCNLQNKLEGDEELQFCDGDMRVVISNILLAGKRDLIKHFMKQTFYKPLRTQKKFKSFYQEQSQISGHCDIIPLTVCSTVAL